MKKEENLIDSHIIKSFNNIFNPSLGFDILKEKDIKAEIYYDIFYGFNDFLYYFKLSNQDNDLDRFAESIEEIIFDDIENEFLKELNKNQIRSIYKIEKILDIGIEYIFIISLKIEKE